MNDDDIWQAYAKSVKKISDKRKSPSRSREGLGVGTKVATNGDFSTYGKLPAHPPAPPASGRGALTAQPHLTALDHRADRDLRQGNFMIDARIDLHGMTQEQAYAALAHFMAKATKAGKRRLLIITGKGRANMGTLKTNLLPWLESLPEASAILTVRPAAPKHGGDGAFYVFLKKGSGIRN